MTRKMRKLAMPTSTGKSDEIPSIITQDWSQMEQEWRTLHELSQSNHNIDTLANIQSRKNGILIQYKQRDTTLPPWTIFQVIITSVCCCNIPKNVHWATLLITRIEKGEEWKKSHSFIKFKLFLTQIDPTLSVFINKLNF